jgi:DNA helicase IV
VGALPESDEQAYEELVARLRKYWVRADERCEDLRRELGAAEEFARSLHGHLAHLLDASVAVSKAVR